MTKGFYFYLTVLISMVFLFGVELKGCIDGDSSFHAVDIVMCFLWCAATAYLVIDEYRLKETYKHAERALQGGNK